jgi:hypothetical protein
VLKSLRTIDLPMFSGLCGCRCPPALESGEIHTHIGRLWIAPDRAMLKTRFCWKTKSSLSFQLWISAKSGLEQIAPSQERSAIFQCWTAAIQDVDESIPHLREENPPRKTHPTVLDRFDEGDAKVGGRKKSSLSTVGSDTASCSCFEILMQWDGES